MTVINPSSISGITSITMPSGDGNVLTIHTNDGTERFRIDSSGNVKVGSACTISQDGDVFFTGVCTATTLTGAASGLTGTLPAISGANLTNLTAGNLTGDLPAISGANLTGIAATDNVRTGILDVAGIATFRSDVNIPNINGGQIGGRRNIIINGAMTVQQQMNANTTGGQNLSGIKTVDRFGLYFSGTDNPPTQIPVDVAAGTTPYSLGFRRCFKIINGNQTSGAGADDYIYLGYKVEAQDIAKSGWNYLSSSSFITLSFWIKSSVAQNFNGHLTSQDGTAQNYPFQTGSLTADTWTKITKTIPGNSNLTFDNDTGFGLFIVIAAFNGTNRTGTVTNDAWAAFSSSSTTNDDTSTWYTTDDATLEITGVQLEVGSTATVFEHRSFGEELHLCHRYFYSMGDGATSTMIAMGMKGGTTSARYHIQYPNTMRATPTFTISGLKVDSETTGSYQNINSISDTLGNEKSCRLVLACDSSASQGNPCGLLAGSTTSYLRGDAEL